MGTSQLQYSMKILKPKLGTVTKNVMYNKSFSRTQIPYDYSYSIK